MALPTRFGAQEHDQAADERIDGDARSRTDKEKARVGTPHIADDEEKSDDDEGIAGCLKPYYVPGDAVRGTAGQRDEQGNRGRAKHNDVNQKTDRVVSRDRLLRHCTEPEGIRLSRPRASQPAGARSGSLAPAPGPCR